MAKLLFVFLQLLFGTFRLCLPQRTDLRSVSPGENITLHCDITVNYEIWWYHQSSEEMKLLVSAVKGKLNKSFSLNYNVDESHYDETDNTSTVDLVIIRVNETDLGLYYCGGRDNTKPTRFGRAIRLNFADDENQELDLPDNITQHSIRFPGCGISWMMIMFLMCVFMFCVLMNIICICVFCWRAQGTSGSGRCCGNTRDTSEEKDLHYASLGHQTEPRASTARTSVPALDTVTYARVIHST